MNRRRRARVWQHCLAGLAFIACWSAVVYANRPSARCRRAEAAMKDDDLERLPYELLGLQRHMACQPHVSLLQGKLLLAAKQPDAALELLPKAVNHPETEAPARVLIGQALYQTGQFLEAGKVWSSVLQLDPDNVDALRWLGIAYYDLGAKLEATHYLEKAARLAPRAAGPHRLIGMMWREAGDWSSAAEAYRESLRRAPRQPDADSVRLELADCYSRLSDDRAALELLAQCPASAEQLALRARCEHRLGHVDAAWRLAQEALRLDPEQIASLRLQAAIASQRGDNKLAAGRLEDLVGLVPKDLEAHTQLSAIYWKLDRKDEAQREKQAVEDLRPLYDQYNSLTERANVDPSDARLRYELGMLARQLDMLSAAREWLRAAIYLDPNDRASQQALAALLAPPPVPLRDKN